MSGQAPVAFAGGPNLAMKVPPHQWETTVAFYRDVLGLEALEPFTGEPASVGFVFGASRLWIDRVAGMSQAEMWLEVTADDPEAAAEHLAAAGVVRCGRDRRRSSRIRRASGSRAPRRSSTWWDRAERMAWRLVGVDRVSGGGRPR